MTPGYWPLVALVGFSAFAALGSAFCSMAVYLMAGDLRHSIEDIKGYLIYTRGADLAEKPTGPARPGDVKFHFPKILDDLIEEESQ